MKKGSAEWKAKYFEECKADIKALAGNEFVENAKAIRDIGAARDVDQGVALDMWLAENKTSEERRKMDLKALAAFKALYRKYYLDYIVEVQKAMKEE